MDVVMALEVDREVSDGLYVIGVHVCCGIILFTLHAKAVGFLICFGGWISL